MADTESEWQLELERSNIQRTISDVEAARAASTAGTRSFFENALLGAKSRLAAIEKKIKETEVEKQRQNTDAVAAVYSAQKEAALSEREKETYSGFLKEEFFTKKDFGRLEEFYAHTWERLSEHGKDEMSHRVWEGIRRDEYKFTDLPKTVREKETDRAYTTLSKRTAGAAVISTIPEKDRTDFIRAYEGGNREEAEKVLNRESFKSGMFRQEKARAIGHTAASNERDGDSDALFAAATKSKCDQTKDAKSPEVTAAGQIDFAALNLKGMKEVQAPETVSPPSVTGGTVGDCRVR